jgi:putative ABC transport system permease protein
MLAALMGQNLRIAVRMLLKQPGFAVVAVLTLALGIGATVAVFSLIQGVLLTPPPYQDPGRLALVPSTRIDGQPSGPRGWATVQWTEWQKQSTSFDAFAAYSWTFNFLIEADGSESLEGLVVTPDYFRVIGVQPVLGRVFVESDRAVTGPPAVIVIGYELWQRKFNGDPNIVGKTLRMSRRDTPPTIIGVLPSGIRFLPVPAAAQEPNYNVNAVMDFMTPAGRNPAGVRAPAWNIVGRMKKGVTAEQAQAELRTITARQAQTERDFEGFAPRVQLLTDEMNRDGRRILLPLFGAAVLVLLIACGNTAALLLVRGLQRQQEYAMRTALGMSRMALFGQASVESLLLASLGGVGGIALAFAIIRIFKAIGGHAIPRLDAVTTGWPVLAGGVVAALFAAVLAGVIPALRATRTNMMNVLKSSGPTSSAGRTERRRLREVTVVQMALTLALVVGAGLLIRTMSKLANVQSGYSTEHILTMTVTMVQGNWNDFHTRALERVAAAPGVQRAAFAWGVPLTGNNWPGTVEIEGRPVASPSDRVPVPQRSVTPGYFSLLGLRLIDGRDFRSSDAGTAPLVAIVNQSFVDRYFASASAIGKKLWFGRRDQPPMEIIGVVSNGRTDDLTREADPEVYFSLWQRGAFSKDLVVRAAGDPRP